MAVVALKNLFVWQRMIPSFSPKSGRSPPLEPGPSDTSSRTAIEIDVESHSTRIQEEKSSSGGSRFNARVISDATIGLSDGLTVPFALTAGLSALGNTRVVIFGGLAELIAGGISMGLGGYLGAKSEAASYRETRSETETLLARDPPGAVARVRGIFEPFGIPSQTLDDLTRHLSSSPKVVDFLMQFQAQEPASSRPFTSALTIALGYFLGGLLPLVPYFCVKEHQLLIGLYISIGVMACALFSFGCVKTCIVTGWRVRDAFSGGTIMVVVGGSAAAAAWGLVSAFHTLVNED